MDDILPPNVELMITWFSALSEHTRKTVFPPLVEGVSAAPDITGWSKLRKAAYLIASPYPTNLTTQSPLRYLVQGIVFLMWGLASACWYSLAKISLDVILGTPQVTSSQSPLKPLEQVIGYILGFIVVFLVPFAYYRWVEFIRDQRYSGKWRLILTLLFILIMVLLLFWGILPEYQMRFSSLLLLNLRRRIGFILVYLLLLIPFITFAFMLIVDEIVLFGRVLVMIMIYLLSVHNPFPRRDLQAILTKPIFDDPVTGEKQRLIELPKPELNVLHKWAEANRESTDKRLLPTVIFFAFIGIFANTEIFKNTVDGILNWLPNSIIMLGKQNFEFFPVAGKWIMLSIFLVYVMLFFLSLLVLISNLVTKSVIIEACIIAEYAQGKDQPLDKLDSSKRHKTFWQWLFGL